VRRWSRDAADPAHDGVPAHAFPPGPADSPGGCRSVTSTWAAASGCGPPAGRRPLPPRCCSHPVMAAPTGSALAKRCTGCWHTPRAGGCSPACTRSRWILASPAADPRAYAICERIIGTLRRELFDRLLIVKWAPSAPGADRIPAQQTARRTVWAGLTGSSSHPATGDQSRRASDPPKTNPRRTHARIPDRRLTAPCCHEKTQVIATIGYSSPTG
jgi:hypothetical protein